MKKKKVLIKRTVSKFYAKIQKNKYINQIKFKNNLFVDMLRARAFRACLKFSRASYAHIYEHAHNFLRPG